MQFQPVCPVHFIRPQQLHPRFCIFRPGGVPTPLIAIDELPSWLQISNPSPDTYIGLQPVSPSYIPREGEYEVTCINCSSSVSSVNHSMSDRNEDVQSPQSSASANKSCTGTSCNGTGENAAAITISKFPIGFNIGNPAFDATRQSPVIGLYSTSRSPLAPQNIPLPSSIVSTASQPSSFGESILGSDVEPSKSDRSDTPTTSADSSKGTSIASTRSLASAVDRPREKKRLKGSSADSSNGTSIASTRSLTAAVGRLRQKIKLKGSSCQASFHRKVHKAALADSDAVWHKSSKYHRVDPGSPRMTKLPRRRRTRLKQSKSTLSSPAGDVKEEVLKLDGCYKNPNYHRVHSKSQRTVRLPRIKLKGTKSTLSSSVMTNSSTKRRARRERLAERLLNHHDVDRKSRYWHMAKIPK
ncbi:hypothetical protein N7451_006484 [Penicillium sp. IBT 35674x]|nr:hypothetical protein N7451_006484 [Penicillium sp. IBT 35674x]